MKNGLTLFIGVLVVLVGLAFVFPAVALLRETGVLPAFSVALLFLGVALTLAGVGAAYHGARRLRA